MVVFGFFVVAWYFCEFNLSNFIACGVNLITSADMQRPIRTLRHRTEISDSQQFAFSHLRAKSEVESKLKSDLYVSGKSSRLSRVGSVLNGFQQPHMITFVREKSIKRTEVKARESNPEQ